MRQQQRIRPKRLIDAAKRLITHLPRRRLRAAVPRDVHHFRKARHAELFAKCPHECGILFGGLPQIMLHMDGGDSQRIGGVFCQLFPQCAGSQQQRCGIRAARYAQQQTSRLTRISECFPHLLLQKRKSVHTRLLYPQTKELARV